MRFSDYLKIAIFRRFCKKFPRYSETIRRFLNFKGLFSVYVPWNLFFVRRYFENVRRNFISDGRIRGNLREIRGKIGENQEKVGENRRILPCFKIR